MEVPLTLLSRLADAQRRGLIDGPPRGQSDHTAAEDWAALVARVTADIRAGLVPKQLAFLDDGLGRGHWVAASCARQCGKNHTVIRLLVLVALTTDGANCVYANETYDEARRVMWSKPRKSLPAALRDLGLSEGTHYWLNNSRMEVRFANGSIVRLLGVDDGGGWERLLGDELDLLVVDEAQKLRDEPFEDALERILPDLFNARGGSCVLIGTPEPFCASVFFRICEALDRTFFTHHHWTAEDLRDLTDTWANQLREKEREGLSDEDPRWMRDKLGLWVRQDDSLMLPLPAVALWDGTYPETVAAACPAHPLEFCGCERQRLPRSRPLEHYAGLDFGFTDSAALVVGSVSREEGVLREVLSWKDTGLDTDALAEALRPILAKHNVRRVYADSARPDTIQTLVRKYRLPIVGAEKHDKVTWIQDMRAKARRGRLQVLSGSKLHDELRVLRPDPDKLKRRMLESPPGAEDHCWDASRYLYRGVFSEQVLAPEPPLSPAQAREAELLELAKRSVEKPRDGRPQTVRRR